MGRTCGEPEEIKESTHPKNITALFRAQALYGVCTVGDPFYIITELCENGSLDSFLAKRKMLKKWVRFTQQHKMGHEIAKGTRH